ncbi:hypothetical protein PPACK8108_LOCUS20447 [Phakopsora pachyrhizi]|uniref:GmrSD restriction endonucleases N-terminal domain-containing protein n=1 Tax=Phakopsora pachyrhizi TaxID=170000 RepID=A0AAV0BIB1_PHAPC|nr:hypothetical protein PPACK8108_LOCUS20447 [Phakopsora pachyrhizi]
MKGDDYLSDSSQETDELDELGLQSANAGNIGNTQVDEIPGAIESANCRVFSTRELYEKMNNDRIDVEPPYQRDVVWPRSSQSALIDSIFKNKWVPTLLFSLRPAHLDRKGKLVKEKWVCMDGKQRLTSVKLFMDGEIPWIERPGTSWYYKQSNPPSPSRMILSEERMEVWLSRGLTTALYSKLSELQERDIFRLVQEGKPLTIGEKMQAAAGAWGEYFDEMTQLYMTNNEHNPNGWCTRIAHLKRGADFKTMTSIILLIRDRLLRPTEAPRFLSSITLQKELTLLLNEKVPEELKKEVTQLLDSFMKVTMLAPPKTRWMVEPHTPDALFYPIIKGRKTMISPVELIWIPYLISVHGPKVSLGRVLELIRNLKIDLRKQYPREVKNNLQVTNFIKEWIHNYDLSKLTGCYKGYDVPAPPLDEEEAEPLSGVSDTQPSGTVFKRPRRAGPTPIPASQPTPRTAPTPASASQPASRAGPTPLTASQGASRALTAQPPRSSLPVGRPSSLFDPNKFSSNNLSTESPTARSSAASNAQASISGRHHTFENQDCSGG